MGSIMSELLRTGRTECMRTIMRERREERLLRERLNRGKPRKYVVHHSIKPMERMLDIEDVIFPVYR